MQKTNYSRLINQISSLLFNFLISSWRSKSISLISVLSGYFLFANFLTKFISEGKNELVMVPVIILIAEFIIRIRPYQRSRLFNLWSIIDRIRVGASYAVILEAFKLGSQKTFYSSLSSSSIGYTNPCALPVRTDFPSDMAF